jgi:hypothetical protein
MNMYLVGILDGLGCFISIYYVTRNFSVRKMVLKSQFFKMNKQLQRIRILKVYIPACSYPGTWGEWCSGLGRQNDYIE